jgi:DNA-binding MarR family transcriptional regulator
MEADRRTLIRGCLTDLLRVGNVTLAEIGRRFEAALGVSLAELDALAELAHAPDRRLSMREIGQRLTISTTSVTRVVDGLEAKGYVSRVLSSGDRRVVYAVLADDGADLLERARPIAEPILEECFGRFFTTAEITDMHSMLRRVIADPTDSAAATSQSQVTVG